MARLFVIATPIGNLEDISPRAARCLREADIVLAEDTRRTRALLSHLGIQGPTGGRTAALRVERLDAQAEARDLTPWLRALDEGQTLALVSDAGAPAVSDPGAALVSAAARAGHEVSPIPGPSAVTTALMAAGFGAERFRFFGFLPRSGSRRREILGEVQATLEPCVLFEAPTRIAATLGDLARIMPEREVVIARELSKLHEELIRGTLGPLAESEAREWRGEITLVLGPSAAKSEVLDEASLDARIDALLAEGVRSKQAAQQLALESGWSVRDIYARISRRRDKP